MRIQPPDSFHILGELDRAEFYIAFSALHVPTSTEVRLTHLTAEISNSPRFRAAFRKDEASLQALHHTNVSPLLFWGEDGGVLFYATERPDGESLNQRLGKGLRFQWDEFTDIGWQIASALQHAHNRGMTHGRLTLDSVIVSKELLAIVVGFGLYHWIAAATTELRTPATFRQLVKQDLIDFGNLLTTMLDAVDLKSEPPTHVNQLAEVQSLLTRLKEPPEDFTARDVQGRLGDMLLKAAGDSIEMIDDREGLGLSRRSIIDELFDDVAKPADVTLPASIPSKPSIRFWLTTVLVIILALMFAMFSPA